MELFELVFVHVIWTCLAIELLFFEELVEALLALLQQIHSEPRVFQMVDFVGLVLQVELKLYQFFAKLAIEYAEKLLILSFTKHVSDCNIEDFVIHFVVSQLVHLGIEFNILFEALVSLFEFWEQEISNLS